MVLDLLHRIAANPGVYDWIQHSVGCDQVFRRVQKHFISAPARTVLEVGAGTGLLRPYLPSTTKYIWLDCDPVKLAGFRRRNHSDDAVLGDATRICIGNAAVRDVLCVSVTHHIPDEMAARMFSELARVASERLIFLDPVLSSTLTGKALWSLDRGSFPRRPERLRELIGVDFDIAFQEEFEVMHRYLCCVATPKRLGTPANPQSVVPSP